MPSISVVIPLYNKAATLGRALDSVLNQSGDDLEVIVIDDASTDASNEVALSFGNRINYVRQENAGPSAARNHGARIARHPLLLFLDADDSLAPGALVAHARAHACIPGSGLSAGSFKLHTLDGSMEEERLDQRLGLTAAEVVHAIRRERARTLTDVLMRRTMIGLEPDLDPTTVARIAEVMASHDGWDADRTERELAAFGRVAARHRPFAASPVGAIERASELVA